MPLLTVTAANADSLAPCGQLVLPASNGADWGQGDAELELQNGQPRFWVMELEHRAPQVPVLARHSRCSQCLASADARPWWVVLAPPQAELAPPDPQIIRLFRIPAGVILKLHPGTWHAGPYFPETKALFFNLELADTNSHDFTEVTLPEPLTFCFDPF